MMGMGQMSLLVLLGTAVGILGSVFGLGGGIFLIPALVLYFKLPMHLAIAASLVTIIATSSAVAAVNVERGLANMRLGMSLEVSTSIGAVAGAFLASRLSTGTLQLLFSLLLFFTAFTMLKKGLASLRGGGFDEDVPVAQLGELGGEYFDPATGNTVSRPASKSK